MACADNSKLDEFDPSVWSQQAKQASQMGTPSGVNHFTSADAQILTFYDDNGCLRGILKYFEKDIPKNDLYGNYLVAHEGEVLVIVDPSYQKRGVGTKLLCKPMEMYPIDFEKQRYTPSGAAFVAKFRQKGAKKSA